MLERLFARAGGSGQPLTHALVATVDPHLLARSTACATAQVEAVPLIEPWSTTPAAPTLPNCDA